MKENAVYDQDMYLRKNPILVNLSSRQTKKVYRWINWCVWMYVLVMVPIPGRDNPTGHKEDLHFYLNTRRDGYVDKREAPLSPNNNPAAT